MFPAYRITAVLLLGAATLRASRAEDRRRPPRTGRTSSTDHGENPLWTIPRRIHSFQLRCEMRPWLDIPLAQPCPPHGLLRGAERVYVVSRLG